jgi:hypothetical protein
MALFLVTILWFAPILAGGIYGNARGKLAAGILLPLFFSWFGVLIVLCLSDRTQSVNTHVHVSNSIESTPDSNRDDSAV